METSDSEPDYVLLSCIWELTLKCTMNCLHCGSVAGAARKQELTVDECLRVADELAALHCREVTLIGGEVFLFRGWEVVARRLADAGIAVNIMTNGYRIDDRQIRQIKYGGLTNVGV